jgi:hypothetical protein
MPSAPLFFTRQAPVADMKFTLHQAAFSNPGRARYVIGAGPFEEKYPADTALLCIETDTYADMLPVMLEIVNKQPEMPEGVWLIRTPTLVYDNLDFAEEVLGGVEAIVLEGKEGFAACYIAIPILRKWAADTISLTALNGHDSSIAPYRVLADAHSTLLEDLSMIRAGMVFDSDMADVTHFRAGTDGAKHIIWTEGRPFLISRQTGLVARAAMIHFPGPSGRLLHQFYTGPGLTGTKILEQMKRVLRK